MWPKNTKIIIRDNEADSHSFQVNYNQSNKASYTRGHLRVLEMHNEMHEWDARVNGPIEPYVFVESRDIERARGNARV